MRYIRLPRVHFRQKRNAPRPLSACVHTCVFIKTRNAWPGKVGCNYRQRASERANGNGHFGHGCCHSHVKHNAPGYHYRCVTPPPPRKTGDGVRRRGGAKRAGDGGRMRCAFPGAPGAPLPVPLPSSATDVIRYHAFVRVRFRAVRDIKLRIERKKEREREKEWKTNESDYKNRSE